MSRRYVVVLVLTSVAVLLLAMLSLSIGQVVLPIGRVVDALLDPSSFDARIVTELRLPRVVGAIVAGASLGTAGLAMQTVFRNPLADPWSLGLTAGGQLGAALIVAATGFVGPSALDFIGALSGISLVLGAAVGVASVAVLMTAVARRVGTITLLVFGLMLSFVSQGLVSIVLHFANRSQGAVFSSWDDGTFAVLTWSDFAVLLPPVVAGIGLILVLSKPLTALLLGETYAASMGVDVARLRRLALIVTILLAAPVTAYCGPVLFLGLIVPHLGREWTRVSTVLPLLPASALIGALLALAADFVVHLPWEQHFLHLNAVLAVIGAPVVMGLLLGARSLRRMAT